MEIIVAIIISVPATIAAIVAAWTLWETIRARRAHGAALAEIHGIVNSRFDEMKKIMFDAGVAAEKRDQAVDDAGNGASPHSAS